MQLHIGTYEKSGGRGLVPLTIAADGTMSAGEPFASAANASFGVRGNGLVFLVDEQDEGAVNVLRPISGGWERVARVASGGKAPCYVALDRDARRLAVANYESGTAALYKLDASGLPRGEPAIFQSHGTGPNPERQEGPHAHCVRFSFGDEALYLVDLGADEVMCLKLAGEGRFADARQAWRAPPGTGPRHLLFHPRKTLAVVLSELAATLTLLDTGDCKLRPRQIISTTPGESKADNLGGHLVLDREGARVYASNRGDNSIVLFALEDQQLKLVQRVESGGNHPRHFVLLERERLLVVAHEKDSRVTAFDVGDDGTLSSKGEAIVVPGACFILA